MNAQFGWSRSLQAFRLASGTVQDSPLQAASALNDTKQNHHKRDDQEEMNESAYGVRSDKTQKPEDNQDNGKGLKHFLLLF